MKKKPPVNTGLFLIFRFLGQISEKKNLNLVLDKTSFSQQEFNF